MLNQSSFGGMPAPTSALLPGFPPNNPGLVRTLLPGHTFSLSEERWPHRRPQKNAIFSDLQ